MKKIKGIIIYLIIILISAIHIISYAAGAQDSNPDYALPNGGAFETQSKEEKPTTSGSSSSTSTGSGSSSGSGSAYVTSGAQGSNPDIVLPNGGAGGSYGAGLQDKETQEALDKYNKPTTSGSSSSTSTTLTSSSGSSSFTDPITDPDFYTPGTNSENDNTKFMERGSIVLGVIRTIGSFVAVITLMTLGIRYMLASTSDKALYKETMVPYLIGAIMVFAIPNLIGILFDIITSTIK